MTIADDVEVRLLYFAALAQAAGRESETIRTTAPDLRALYAERAKALGIDWPVAHLRVAVDGAFADWGSRLHDGAEVVFIPPVSGG
ncbi:MAG: molybdopterin synthase sulfur carrier subunit [Gammaproteobacteria bacterium HGW-Gammaproteobacteria-7]|nr:MAG: molybdopterin synthase sulfur carrier subunit [Gammaproteobacteria bacterium HGW-Gammaproteobacteria-7]